MKLQNPTLTLTFGSDLETGHSSVQIINSAWILNHSIVTEKNMFNGLRSSSDLVTIGIRKGCPSIEDILATEEDIKAVLKDGNTVLFTGYLSDSYSYTVNQYGEKDMKFTIESVGARRLKKTFLEEGYFYFQSTFENAVRIICATAEVDISSSTTFPLFNVKHEASEGATCYDLLSSLCYEVGYVFYFDNIGQLRLKSIPVESLTGAKVLDGTNLYHNGTDAITIRKVARQYRSASVTFTSLSTKNNVVVFSATPFQIEGGQWYDGTQTGSSADNPPYIEAINAASDPDIGSGKIVGITSPTLDVSASTSLLKQTLNFLGGRYFQVTGHNETTTTQKYNKFDVKANVVYEKSTEIIRTSAEGETYREELKWIHDAATAKRTANIIDQYNKYCGLSYTFRTKDTIEPGTICHIQEPLSGLDVYCMVTGYVDNSATDVVQYKAVGVSVFNLSGDVTQEGMSSSSSVTKRTIVEYAVIPESVDFGKGESYGADDDDFVFGFSSDSSYGSGYEWTEGQIDPSLVQPGYYIWMRTSTDGGVTWTYTRLTGGEGKDGNGFILTLSASTYVVNKRLSTNNYINVEVQATGYIGTPVVRCTTNASLYNATTKVLTIPKNTGYESVTMEATLTGAPTQTVTIYALDHTEYNKYLGDNLSGVVILPGDSYFNPSTNVIQYRNTSNTWVNLNNAGLSNAEISEICSMAQKDALSRIQPGSVILSDYAYLNTIIANCITADYIGAKDITLDGGSIKSKGFVSGSTGFKISSNGDSEFVGLVARNGVFYGTSFECPTFSSAERTSGAREITTPATSNGSTQAAYVYQYFRNEMVDGAIYPVTVSSDSSLKYIIKNDSIWQFLTETYVVTQKFVGLFGASFVSMFDGTNTSFTLKIGTGHVFKLKNLPVNEASCEKDMVYVDANGFLKIKR